MSADKNNEVEDKEMDQAQTATNTEATDTESGEESLYLTLGS